MEKEKQKRKHCQGECRSPDRQAPIHPRRCATKVGQGRTHRGMPIHPKSMARSSFKPFFLAIFRDSSRGNSLHDGDENKPLAKWKNRRFISSGKKNGLFRLYLVPFLSNPQLTRSRPFAPDILCETAEESSYHAWRSHFFLYNFRGYYGYFPGTPINTPNGHTTQRT